MEVAVVCMTTNNLQNKKQQRFISTQNIPQHAIEHKKLTKVTAGI